MISKKSQIRTKLPHVITYASTNFIVLGSGGTNIFVIHLTDEGLSCKCCGSIFREYALTLELNDISERLRLMVGAEGEQPFDNSRDAMLEQTEITRCPLTEGFSLARNKNTLFCLAPIPLSPSTPLSWLVEQDGV